MGVCSSKGIQHNPAIFKIEGDLLIRCLDKSVRIAEIPEGIKELGKSAFRDCENLKSVVLPTSLKIIGFRAFENCKKLESIVIPEGVEDLGDWAFIGCEALKSVMLPSSLKRIPCFTFQNCTNLENIVIPEGVTKIVELAFASCDKLKLVMLPTSLKKIDKFAFYGCDNLEKIYVNELAAEEIRALLPAELRDKVTPVSSEKIALFQPLLLEHTKRLTQLPGKISTRLCEKRDIHPSRSPLKLHWAKEIIADFLSPKDHTVLSIALGGPVTASVIKHMLSLFGAPKQLGFPLEYNTPEAYQLAIGCYVDDSLKFVQEILKARKAAQPALLLAPGAAAESPDDAPEAAPACGAGLVTDGVYN